MSSSQWPSRDFLAGFDMLEQGDFPSAAVLFGDALGECERNGDALNSARCMRWVAEAQAEMGEPDRASESLRQALRLLDVVVDGDELRLECLASLGLLNAHAGRTDVAVEMLGAAATLGARLPDRGPEADCSYELATFLMSVDDFSAAATWFRRAARCYVAELHWADAADSHQSAGICWIELEDAASALVEFRSARDLYQQAPDDLGVAGCRYLLGLCSSIDNLPEAQAEMLRAIDHFAASANYEAEGDCWEQLGELYIDAERVDDAFLAFGRGLSCNETAGRATHAAYCHRQIGRLHAHRRSLEEALSSFASAESLYSNDEPTAAAELALIIGAIEEDRGRYFDAISAYERGRQLHRRVVDSTGVALCDMHVGTARMHLGELGEAERLLASAAGVLVTADDPTHLANCLRYQAAVKSACAEYAEAKTLLHEALRVIEHTDAVEVETDCRQDLAILQMVAGDYVQAGRSLESVRQTFLQLGMHEKAALCQQNAGASLLMLGRYAEAERALVESRTTFDEREIPGGVAMSDIHLGQLYLETGRYDVAEVALTSARNVLRHMGASDRVAIVEQNLGGLHFALRNLDAAEGAYRRAADLFAGLHQPFRSAVCKCNIGAVAFMKSEFAWSSRLIGDALEVLTSDAAYRRTSAGALRNRSAAEFMLGNASASLRLLGDARALSVELEITIDVAKCDILAAVWDVSTSGGERLREAIDLALPAIQYMDAQRFQFAESAHRNAWANTIAEWRSAVFDWAYRLGDDTILSDLIESSINAGTHVAVTGREGSFVSLLATEVAAKNPRRSPKSELVLGGSGAGFLIAGAVLPMNPPPLIRLPNNRIVLGEFFGSMTIRYGAVARPATIDLL